MPLTDFPEQPVWPFAQTWPGVHLSSCRYAVRERQAEDFAALGIQAPEHILKAAAKRQSEFLAGRRCARVVLNNLGVGPLVPGLDEERAPLWPGATCGSISHSHGWAGAVAARQRDWLSLGLDAEAPLEVGRASRLAGQILTPQERDSLARLPAERQAWLVRLTFSAKESLFKALYPLTGVRFYFQDAELLMADQGVARLRLLKTLSAEWTAGRELPARYAEIDGQLLSLVAVAAE